MKSGNNGKYINKIIQVKRKNERNENKDSGNQTFFKFKYVFDANII